MCSEFTKITQRTSCHISSKHLTRVKFIQVSLPILTPYFVDQIRIAARFLLRIAMYLTGWALAVGFSWCWLQVLQPLHERNQVDFLEIYDGTKQEDLPTFLAEAYNMSMRWKMDSMAYLGILVGVVFSLYFLREIILAFAQLSAFRKLAKLLRRAFLWISEPISRKFTLETPV